MIEEFYKSLIGNLANGSIQKVKNVLSGMFRTAVRWQMIQVNPCRDAKLAKNKDEETVLKYFTPGQSLIKKPKTKTSVRTVSMPDLLISLLKQYKREYNKYRLQLGTAMARGWKSVYTR